jgi:hypothetical protein
MLQSTIGHRFRLKILLEFFLTHVRNMCSFLWVSFLKQLLTQKSAYLVRKPGRTTDADVRRF